MRTLGLATAITLATTLATAACAAPADTGRTIATRTDDGGIDIVDTGSGRTVRELPTGVPAPDWSALYAAKTEDDRTTVTAIDPGTGATLASAAIEGAFEIASVGRSGVPTGLARDGRSLVLVPTAAAADGMTRFAVLPTALDGDARILELEGSFTYDAFSPDGSILYVVQHPDPADPAWYVVRAVDVVPGQLREDVVVDKRNIDEKMAGTPIAQAEAPSGWTYTLYAGKEHLFVHGLDTPNAGAVCIDLPAPGDPAELNADDWALAMRPDGRRLWVVSARHGQIHELDASEFRVTRSRAIDPAGDGGTALTLASDGATLYVGGASGITVVRTDDLSVAARHLSGTAVRDIAVAADGVELVVLDASGSIHRLDPADGDELGMAPATGRPADILGTFGG